MAQAAVDFQIQQLVEQQQHQQQEQEQEEHLQEQEEHLQEEKAEPLRPMKELNRDIFLDDKAIKINNSSKVKARNFLTNVSYNRIAASDFENNNFVIDCFTFMIIYLNPFYLERKFETVIEREFINVLWAFLMPESLYRYINLDDNLKTLNKINVKYQEAKAIIINFLEENPANLSSLSAFLQKNAVFCQYLYGNLFPKCFSRVNDYGLSAKTSFNKYYHGYILQKDMLNIVKEEEEQEKQEQKEIKEKQFESPLNMTTLFDVQNDDDNDGNDKMINENKENIPPKTNKKEKKVKKAKRKIETKEQKKQLREAKKKKLLEELNENTEKMMKIKAKK